MGVEEGKEIQSKGNDNLFNRIAENFPNLKKESHPDAGLQNTKSSRPRRTPPGT
jgi:hypothetical protein